MINLLTALLRYKIDEHLMRVWREFDVDRQFLLRARSRHPLFE